MYLSILKKDLKRKKTMNFILLMFIILSAMFASSSVNNILSVTNALDGFFEKADAPDYFIATADNGKIITNGAENESFIKNCGEENIFYLSPENVLYNGEKPFRSDSLIMDVNDRSINYFNSSDEPITDVNDGEVIVPAKCVRSGVFSIGGTIEIKLGNVTQSFKITDCCKDAVLGSELMGMPRFIISSRDFAEYGSDPDSSAFAGQLIYIYTDDVKAAEKYFSKQEGNIAFSGSASMLRTTYIMDVMTSGILLAVSICLILIAFAVLRFTITFTVSQEFREIGVMKAIGIKNIKIRSLYMAKYFALASSGSVIGFFAGIPFGNMLLRSVSETMVMKNSSGVLINAVCSFAVSALILLFCFRCTGRINRLSPIDAIRNGETGERYSQKGMLRLSTYHLKPTGFMALNDILSSPKRFGVITAIFYLSLSLVLILVNTVNTLKSDDLIQIIGLSKTDAYITDTEKLTELAGTGSKEKFEETLRETEKTLKENGIPAECVMEAVMKLTLTHGENVCSSFVYSGIGTTADRYIYCKGTAPQNPDEIAITKITAEKLEAKIGDTVKIDHNGENKEYIITALFQSLNNLGEGVRLHEDAKTDLSRLNNLPCFQINFTDSPSKAEKAKRFEKLKSIYGEENVFTAGEFADNMASVSKTLSSVKNLVLAIAIIITAFVTVLMEYSFIIKEHSEIAIMKAIGFKNRNIINIHSLRFIIASLLASVLAAVTTVPLTSLSIGPVFRIMGASFGVRCNIIPSEVFAVYPLMILAAAVLSALFSANGIRKIQASDASATE